MTKEAIPHQPPQRLQKARFRSAQCVAFLLITLNSLVHAQQVSPQREAPQLVRIAPSSAAPHTGIELEGYRLGANLDKGVRVLFRQGTAQYSVPSGGGGYETANLEHGLQLLDVVVPDEMQPGPCQVEVEVEGHRGEPIVLQIVSPATAPVIIDITPRLARPAKLIWVRGSGFSDSDEAELTDAQGRVRHIQQQGSSNVDVLALTLPADLPSGEARLQINERRSGTNQRSNVLSFSITGGPTPLFVYEDWLMPVAPGQWLNLVVANSNDPLAKSARVEVGFKQRDQFLIVATASRERLRVRVPEALSPGSVEIQTRSWVGDEVSQWSEPVTYRLLDNPAPAKIYSLEIRPVRAEAAFKQGDRIVAIVSVDEVDYPRVRVPLDKLSPGLIEVGTRVWRGGQPSAWLFKHFGFSLPTTFLPDGTMGEVPFMERVYLGPDTPKALTVYPGESLILQGTFPTASVEKWRVTLECDGRLPVTLNPMKDTRPDEVKIQLPGNLEDGDWDVTVSNVEDHATAKVPIKLRLIRVGL